MRRLLQKLLTNLWIIAVMYTFCVVLRLVYLVQRWVGRIEIIAPENFPGYDEPRLLAVSNHQDVYDCMYEVFLVPALFMPLGRILLHPVKSAPWVTPDEQNFMENPVWQVLIGSRAIGVRRGKSGWQSRELRRLYAVRGIAVTQPEGGRTCTARPGQLVYSKAGRKMRKLKHSVGWLAQHGFSVWPVWIENGDVPQQPGKRLFSWPNFRRGKVVVKFGRLMRFPEGTKSATELTAIIEKNLLRLADSE